MDIDRQMSFLMAQSNGVEGVPQTIIKLHRGLQDYFLGVLAGTTENHEGYNQGFMESVVEMLQHSGPMIVKCVVGTDNRLVDDRVVTGHNIIRSISIRGGLTADLYPKTVLRIITEEELDRLALASMLQELNFAEIDTQLAAHSEKASDACARLTKLRRVYDINIAQILERYDIADPRRTDEEEPEAR